MGLETMEKIQREAIARLRAEGKLLYEAVSDKDEGVFSCPASTKKVKGYTLVNSYFVDNSGFGSEDEPTLTPANFLAKVKAGFFYGIIEQGQFQVYIGEFKKIAKPRAKILAEQGITSSKLISKSCRITKYNNGDFIVRLYSTDIITIRGNKIILNSGGYKTLTTKARLNEFLADHNIRVWQEKHNWYIDDRGTKRDFFDGIELKLDTY